MIVVASDDSESYKKIDHWARIIRNADQKNRPICLVLVNKNEGEERDIAKSASRLDLQKRESSSSK